MNKLKVLIIEDQAPVADLIRRYLEPYAGEIVIAEDMQHARAEISGSRHYDIITLDLRLPDSSIDATIQYIKEIKQQQEETLVIVITGMTDSDLEKRVLGEGADAFLQKSDAVLTESGFMGNLRDVLKSIVRQPTKYLKSVAILEEVAKNISEQFPASR